MVAAPVSLNNPILDEIDKAHASLSPEAQQAIAMGRSMGAPPAAPSAHTMDRSPVPSPSAPSVAPIAPPAVVGPVPAAKPAISGPNDVSVPGIPVSRATPAPSPMITPPNPAAEGHRAELNRLTSSPAGVDAIKHAGLRIPLQVLSAIGSGLFPGIAMGIPGTELHHNLLVRQAENAVNADESAANNEARRGLETAQTANQNAEAQARLNPIAKTATNEMERFFQQNPNATVEDWRKFELDHPEKDTKQGGTVHEDAEGNYWVIHPDGSATAVTSKGSQLKGKPAEDKGGTVHEDAEGNMWIVKGDGTATPVMPKGGAGQLKGKVPGKTENAEQQFIDEYQKLHAGATVAEAQRAYEKNKQLPPQTDRGQNFVDPTTHKLVRVEPGGAVPEGAVTASGLSGENVATEKQDAAAKKARDDAQKEYQLAEQLVKNPSPTNDVALIMRYIGATKPDSLGKLRLNNNEIRLVEGTRSSLGDLEALAAKVTSGERLTDKQRHDMLDTMRILGGIEAGGGTRVQQNSKGEFRYSKDGGKTWQAGKPQ